MEELWRKVTELMAGRPWLWLPVLVADVLAFLIGLGSKVLLQHILVDRFATRSVLGGPTVVAPLNASAVQSALQIAAPIEWGANLLRLLLYTLAFLATAALVRAFRARSRRPTDEIGLVLRKQFVDVLPVAGTALLVYLVTAFLGKAVSDFLRTHGHRNLLLGGAYVGGWFGFGVGVITTALLAWLVAPAAIQALARRSVDPAHRRQAQILAFALGLAALVLSRFVQANLMALHASAITRALLGITGSWIAALPYAVLFSALGLLAIKSGWGMGEAAADTGSAS